MYPTRFTREVMCLTRLTREVMYLTRKRYFKHRFWTVRVPPFKIFWGGSRPMRNLDSGLPTNHRPRFQTIFCLWPFLEAATWYSFTREMICLTRWTREVTYLTRKRYFKQRVRCRHTLQMGTYRGIPGIVLRVRWCISRDERVRWCISRVKDISNNAWDTDALYKWGPIGEFLV